MHAGVALVVMWESGKVFNFIFFSFFRLYPALLTTLFIGNHSISARTRAVNH